MDFCSQACLSCLAASNVFHSSFFCWMVDSTSLSQSRFASGTSDHTRLKSPAQLSCSAGHHISQSTISFLPVGQPFVGAGSGPCDKFRTDYGSVSCLYDICHLGVCRLRSRLKVRDPDSDALVFS